MLLGELTEAVSQLAGVGKTGLNSLANLGIQNCADLLRHYPSSYLDRRQAVPIHSSLNEASSNSIVRVLDLQQISSSGHELLKVIVEDSSGSAALLCYNRSFLAKQFKLGEYFFLAGQFSYKYSELQASQFEFEPYSSKPKLFNCILPVYRLTGKLRQQQLRNWLEQVVATRLFAIEDELPRYLLDEQGLYSKQQALRAIHFPFDNEQLKVARHSLIFEELFHLMLLVAHRRFQQKTREKERQQLPCAWQQQLEQNLAYQLTSEQRRVLQEISDDLQQDCPMQRLLQGDVGCGKTIVALLSALPILEQQQQQQVALMAPTEVLAQQLYRSVQLLLEQFPLTISYLSSQLTSKEKQQLQQHLADGSVDLVVGTHALFSQQIKFKKLSYVIIDEQHRFGVEQRLAIRNKGDCPDLLLMSATPIPRTLALTVYGDLAISTIGELPAQRLAIITHIAEQRSIERVYSFIEKELQQGQQAYFIYPLVNENQRSKRRSVEEMAKTLKQRFSSFHVGLIHGQLKDVEKQQVMNDFTQHRLDLLVASTVIEVGIDVANASTIVIDDAPVFGLAQLHQLRGRVGRGTLQSYCFLVYQEGLSAEAKQRLKVLKDNIDGFLIAEHDFALRGPGDLLGTRQSGYPSLYLADLRRDWQLLQQISRRTAELLHSDPSLSLEEHQGLRKAYQIELELGEQQMLESG